MKEEPIALSFIIVPLLHGPADPHLFSTKAVAEQCEVDERMNACCNPAIELQRQVGGGDNSRRTRKFETKKTENEVSRQCKAICGCLVYVYSHPCGNHGSSLGSRTEGEMKKHGMQA